VFKRVESYRSYNFDGLTGEDAGGLWKENTDELDNNDDTDSIIDIQNIYNTRGPGLYRFTYTLFFQIIMFATIKRLFYLLPKATDYTGATL
jgi:hypothetical protein